MTHTSQGISPLRQRMIDDMRMRKLAPKTQAGYVRVVRQFTAFLGRLPDTATVEDLRRYQLHLVDHGISPVSLNAAITGLKFFFEITLNQPALMARMQPVRVPHTLPVVLSPDEVARLIAAAGNLKHQTALSVAYGTGLRASVMLHLPALVLIKQIEKVFRALQKINLAVRGLYGEGSRASGDFYQISNQVTLGKSETTIINEIRDVIPQIISYERQARQTLTRESRPAVLDKVRRAYGTLNNAEMMTSEETMDLLSSVRLGVNLGLIDDINILEVNELFIHTQPAHLQKLLGKELDSEERNSERARFLRNRLREINNHMN